MTKGQRNLTLAAVLIFALVALGYALRTTPDAATGPTPGTSTSPSGSQASPSSSADPSASGSASASTLTSGASPSAGLGSAIKTVVFVGDSFTAGIGATTPDKRWSTLVAIGHGWTEKNLGHPQSGYASYGTQGVCAAADSCPNYLAVVPQVVAAAPELVIVSGGGNDAFLDQTAVKTNVDQTIAGIRAGLPNAKIVVVNPWWDMRPVPDTLATVAESIKTAAAAQGATWADTGQPIVGKVDLVTSDGLQANDAGHAAMAKAIDGALKLAGITD